MLLKEHQELLLRLRAQDAHNDFLDASKEGVYKPACLAVLSTPGEALSAQQWWAVMHAVGSQLAHGLFMALNGLCGLI